MLICGDLVSCNNSLPTLLHPPLVPFPCSSVCCNSRRPNPPPWVGNLAINHLSAALLATPKLPMLLSPSIRPSSAVYLGILATMLMKAACYCSGAVMLMRWRYDMPRKCLLVNRDVCVLR